MSDLIDRRAVKEWLTRWEGYIDKDTIARMQCRVIDIPSAQPDFNTVEKIDKAYDDGYKCGYLQAKSDYETDMRGKQDG